MSNRDRFDKFTERSRRVLHHAQEEAQRLQHNYIGTEHLLLGLLVEGEGVAAVVLRSLNVDTAKARNEVEAILGKGTKGPENAIGLTPRAKKVIELAVDEAHRFNHHYIGTEHLLLGLVRENQGPAAGVLHNLGVNLEQVRLETLRILQQGQVPGNFTNEPAQQAAPVASTQYPPTAKPIQSRTDVVVQTRSDRPYAGYPLTKQAHIILKGAQEEALRFSHSYIREGEGVAGAVLQNLGVDLNRVRKAVEFIIGRGDRVVLGEIGLTPRSKKILQLASEEAKRMNNAYVGTEHLLLGMVKEGEGIAAGVLNSLGVYEQNVRAETARVLKDATYEK